MDTASSPSPGAVPAQFDTGADLHPPELYQPNRAAKIVSIARLEDISAREIALYHEHGYLVVREAFDAAKITAALAGLHHLVMGGLPDFTQIWFEAGAREILSTLTAEQREDAVRKIAFFTEVEPRLNALAADDRLLGVIRRLLGGAAPFMFQDMLLLKPPRLGREKPWHQDHAYFDYPLGTPIVGAWIALDAATVENGCMQLLPGRHKEGPIAHFKRRDWQICDKDILGTRSIAAELPPGGLLLFDGLLPHGTPHNSSPQRRRALQFHYAPAGITKTAQEERMKIFGSEGKDVTC